ncbi:response regulator transcription factor [Variovorax sp. RB2P76]|uniref:helix-turn-helix transcriptional regulator n=1 Tax=Variovorax sp. RB2P76 TaxID=3443736 RepID=UPI003F47E1BC
MSSSNRRQIDARLEPIGSSRDVLATSWHPDQDFLFDATWDARAGGTPPPPALTPALQFIEGAQRELAHLMRLIAEGDSAAATRVAWSIVEQSRAVLEFEALSPKDGVPLSNVASTRARSSPSGNVQTLSRRELDVLRLISQGLSNRQIANASHRSLHTVDAHVKSIYRKLAVNSRARAVCEAMQRGIVDLHEQI